jgi:peptidoglycan/xylan/chitin deacetylase (PgdA/CDA1 family)
MALVLLLGIGGCAGVPKAPFPGETEVGPPLPYEPPIVTLKSAPALAPVPPRVVRSGSRRKKRVALTFDACSTEAPGLFDAAVIRTLVQMRAPATLFLGGKWMEEHPDETMELARHPQFELGNHTYHHPHLPRESNERVREEIQRTQDMLYTLTGHTVRLFRAPYVEIDTRVARIVGELGLISVQTDLASGDPDPRIGARRLADYVVERAKNGSIVIMHMNGRGWHTAEALPRIILKLRKAGFRLVTVNELLGLPPAAAPPATQGLNAR